MDPAHVFKNDELLKFWPTATQSARERTSATTRFILYAMCLLYILSRDPRVFALGVVALAVLFYMSKSNMISAGGPLRPTYGTDPNVTLPTMDNSMGNVLLTDDTDDPNRPAAAWYPSVRDRVQAVWSQIHPFERQRDAERNFYTAPSSTIPNDQTGFAYAAFGKPFATKCHDQGGVGCDPDRFYSAFPERVQMRAGFGGTVASAK